MKFTLSTFFMLLFGIIFYGSIIYLIYVLLRKCLKKNENERTLKTIRMILLLLGTIIPIIGSIYIAISYKNYAISCCLIASAMMMFLLWKRK